MPRANSSDLKEYLIECPEIPVQERITAQFDKLVSIIDARKAELDKLDELIKARFVELFGTPYGNEKGFPMKTVADVIEFTGGSQPDKKYFEYEPSEDNIRLIQIRDYKTDNYITYIPKSMAKKFCDADDIMIGRYGPPIFQILKGIEGAYNVALMKATPKMGNKEFVRYFLMQDCLFDYLDGLSQRTAGQSGIEMPALKAYPFPYPPIELQNEFEQFAKQVDKSKVVDI
jgi:type I restriction enzyme S subunit